jgi:hypothetical protein
VKVYVGRLKRKIPSDIVRRSSCFLIAEVPAKRRLYLLITQPGQPQCGFLVLLTA